MTWQNKSQAHVTVWSMGLQPAVRRVVLCGPRHKLCIVYVLWKSHNNRSGWVYHLLLFYHVRPANLPVVTGVSLCHIIVGQLMIRNEAGVHKSSAPDRRGELRWVLRCCKIWPLDGSLVILLSARAVTILTRFILFSILRFVAFQQKVMGNPVKFASWGCEHQLHGHPMIRAKCKCQCSILWIMLSAPMLCIMWVLPCYEWCWMLPYYE